ncbi:MAG: hypothetical protein QOH96_3528, partial [Blastocatellia bacterium]|nr:hypothetical protein [Blastocatellia bacterium]
INEHFRFLNRLNLNLLIRAIIKLPSLATFCNANL